MEMKPIQTVVVPALPAHQIMPVFKMMTVKAYCAINACVQPLTAKIACKIVMKVMLIAVAYFA